jgi:hypothetical protein
MRKRLRKKYEKKKIEKAMLWFRVKKAMAIAQLGVNTTFALAMLRGQPIGIRNVADFHIRVNHEARLRALRSATFRDDKELVNCVFLNGA